MWDAKFFEEAMQLFAEALQEQPQNEAFFEHLMGVWTESKHHVLSWSLRETVCKTLKPYTSVAGMNRFDTARFCFRHGFPKDATEIYHSIIADMEAGLIDDIKDINSLKHNKGLAKIFDGDDAGIAEIESVFRDVLSTIPKDLLSPTGSSPPYTVYLVNRLLDFFPYEIFVPKQDVVYSINHPPPKDSGLAVAKLHTFSDKSGLLFEFKDIYQVEYGVYRTPNNDFIIYDVGIFGTLTSYTSSVLNHTPVSKVVEIDTGLFLAAWSKNYYHWLIEGMSRLVYAMNNGYFDRFPGAVITLPAKEPAFITQSLNMISFPLHRRKGVNFPSEQAHYKRLHIPVSGVWDDLPPFTSSVHNQLPSRSLIQNLNKFLTPHPKPLSQRTQIIYISRKDEHRNTYFDDSLIPRLKTLFGNKLEILTTPIPTVQMQREMFQRARIVIGAHGAGLANIIFAAPNKTAIIEFPMDSDHHNLYFSHVAASLDMYYWQLPALVNTYYTNYENKPAFVDAIIKAATATAAFMEALE